MAKQAGAAHVIVYTRENFVERVKEITGGKGVPVVYDGVGKDTFPASLDCLVAARAVRLLRQRLGADRRVQPRRAGAEGIAVRHAADARDLQREARSDLLAMADELFDARARGRRSSPKCVRSFRSREAAEAHRALESRSTTGATLLLP